MNKEQLINRHARNLKSLVGTGLAQDECQDIIKYAVNEALTLYGVGGSKRFERADLLRAYQAGCLENKDDCVNFGFDDLKELKQDANKWTDRYIK